MKNIDGKFATDGSRIFNKVSGEPIPEDEPLFLLRGRDVNAPAALQAYLETCADSGCNPVHVEGILQALHRFLIFQQANRSRVKEPGITGDFKL